MLHEGHGGLLKYYVSANCLTAEALRPQSMRREVSKGFLCALCVSAVGLVCKVSHRDYAVEHQGVAFMKRPVRGVF